MYTRHITGAKGEYIAKEYLEANKYHIIQRNFRCRQGEIDIVAEKNNEIIFIEVKTRTNSKYGEPIEAVTYIKEHHIIKSIEYYLYINKLEDSYIRIDVIEIYKKGNKYIVNHIKNAINYI